MGTGSARTMGFGSLLFNTLGISIGGGIVAYLGYVFAVAGRSSIFTVLICLILGIGLAMPYYLLGKLTSVKGYQYSIVVENLGVTAGGIAQYMGIADIIFFSTYPIAIANYIATLIPIVNKTLVAVAVILLVYIICISGLEVFSRFQSIFTVTLLTALSMYIIAGVYILIKNGINPFDFSDPNYFYGGIKGVIAAVPMIIFYTYAYSYIIWYSYVAKNPTKNIPKAMLIGGLAVMLVWILMTIVSVNVLPVEVVANQPLTFVAKETLPKPLALFFVIGGSMFAILTSYLGLVPSTSFGFLKLAQEGWLPKAFAKTNKANAPYVIFTLIQGLTLAILLSGISVETLLYEIAFLWAVGGGIGYVALTRLPKKHPELFEREGAKVSKTAYYIAAYIAVILAAYIFYLSIQGITITVLLIDVAIIAAFVVIALYLVKNNRIHTEANFDLGLDEEDDPQEPKESTFSM